MSTTRCSCCQSDRFPCRCRGPWCDGCERCGTHCGCIDIGTEVPAIAGVIGPGIAGIGRDAATVTNPAGGKQAATPFALDALPFRALLAVARVLKHGKDKYGKDNWRHIPRWDHLNHALAHICAYGAGDQSDDHLEHAACRLLFALETE